MMHTKEKTSQDHYNDLLTRILILVICTSLFSFIGSIGIGFLFLNQEKDQTTRSKITREIVVTVGACLIEPPPKVDGQALRRCVNRHLDAPIRQQYQKDLKTPPAP